MASANGALHVISFSPPELFTSIPIPDRFKTAGFRTRNLIKRSRCCRVIAQQKEVMLQGPSSNYAREMERLSAKESLLLALRDSGGLECLVEGKITEMQKIDVNERIVGLERLNPTPRPTTSPFLEGRWNFEWFEAGSPGLLAAKVLLQQSPPTLAKLLGLNMLIKDGYSKVSANLRFLNSIEMTIFLSTKLSIEGPIRLKEEYIEGVFETPSVNDKSIPEQLKGALQQAAVTLEQISVPIKDILANGVKIPLNGSYQRLLMISYIDEEILIARDTLGSPDVFTRSESPVEEINSVTFPDYES